MVGSSGTTVRAGLIARLVDPVVGNLPALEVLIPLADQPKHNVPPRVSKLKKALSQCDGDQQRKVENDTNKSKILNT
jgi:hypothetical protein